MIKNYRLLPLSSESAFLMEFWTLIAAVSVLIGELFITPDGWRIVSAASLRPVPSSFAFSPLPGEVLQGLNAIISAAVINVFHSNFYNYCTNFLATCCLTIANDVLEFKT